MTADLARQETKSLRTRAHFQRSRTLIHFFWRRNSVDILSLDTFGCPRKLKLVSYIQRGYNTSYNRQANPSTAADRQDIEKCTQVQRFWSYLATVSDRPPREFLKTYQSTQAPVKGTSSPYLWILESVPGHRFELTLYSCSSSRYVSFI